MLKKLNYTDFKKEVLDKNGVVLVDFYADWCGPCQMMAPVLQEVANENSGITVAKVNVDESPELAGVYGVMSIPTLIVFKDGKPVSQNIGYCPKEKVEEMINI